MNLSKLQSEAVKTFLTEGTKNGCGDLSIMVSVLTDQIQKAVEETRKEIIDKLENIKKKRIMVDSGWFMIDIVEIEELLLSIQSKGKMK